MTQIERTIKVFNEEVERNTILTKTQYRELASKHSNWREHISLSSWDTIIANPERFNVERIELFHTVPTSKITTIDVLEMVKKGCSVEEIEKAIYTTVKEIRIIIK